MKLDVFVIFVAFVVQGSVSTKVLLQGPENYATLRGRTVSLLCNVVEVSGNRTVRATVPFNLTWSFTPVGKTKPRAIVTWIRHYNGHSTNISINYNKYKASPLDHLTISNVTLEDAGTYGCSLNITRKIKTAHLYVIERPTCHNEKNEIKFHQKTTFDCHVRFAGDIIPTVDWKHGDRVLPSTKTQHNATDIIATLSKVADNDMNGHIYNCHVTYPKLFSVRCQALPPLKILIPVGVTAVIFNPRQKSPAYKPGTLINLNCVAHGYPAPLYTWYFAPAFNQTRYIRLSSKSYYQIRNFQAKNQGTYMCMAKNEINGTKHNDSLKINITILGSPSEPQVNPGGNNAAYIVKGHTPQNNGGMQSGSSNEPDLKTPLKSTVNNSGESPHRYKSIFSPYAIGALISAGLAILLIIIFVILAMRMKNRERRMREKISRAHDETLDDQEVELLDESIQQRVEYMPSEYSKLRMSWEIPRRDIRLVEQVGKGTYVEVWKGRMRRQPSSNEIIRVAIKKLISESSEKERRLFVSELEVLKMLPAHNNIIRLVGSYTSNEPWLILLEFAGEGTLQEYLQRHRPGEQEVVINHSNDSQAVRLRNQALTSHKLLALAAQVASGLDHLQKFKLIYYRLRTASILVGKGGISKLSGFAFPQEITERNIYEATSAPVRWLSPESLLDNTFNIKSDVWAFGIVLWEIIHFGMTPYPAMGPQEVFERIQSGFRMPQPQHCSAQLFDLMSSCWHGNPEDRPVYSYMLEGLTELASEPDSHILFDRMPDYLKTSDGPMDDTFS